MSDFSEFLGLSYIEGRQDCYSIVRRYYLREWGLKLPNLARPSKFWTDPLLDLYQMYKLGGFEAVFDTSYQIGDALLMPLGTPFATHAGVIVEDNKILHHLPNKLSCIDDLRPRWSTRATAVLRHPDITATQKQNRPPSNQFHEIIDARLLRNPEFQDVLARAIDRSA